MSKVKFIRDFNILKHFNILIVRANYSNRIGTGGIQTGVHFGNYFA